MADLEIHPLNLGETVLDVKAKFTYFDGWNQSIPIVYLAWLIKGPDEVVLVDTGPGDGEWARRNRGIDLHIRATLAEQLADHGLTPRDIRKVIFTHLHWDHCVGREQFPNATSFVQKKELVHAFAPVPLQYGIYGWQAEGGAPLLLGGPYTALEGDSAISPGVRTILTPGHTPGLQGVLVEARNHLYFLASDNLPLYENWKKDPPIVSGIHVDLEEYYRSLRRVGELGVDHVLPGHDPAVLNHGLFT